MMLVRPSIPERLARLQRVCDAFECFALAAQTQKRLALEIQHLLFGERRRMRQIAAGEYPRDRAELSASALASAIRRSRFIVIPSPLRR